MFLFSLLFKKKKKSLSARKMLNMLLRATELAGGGITLPVKLFWPIRSLKQALISTTGDTAQAAHQKVPSQCPKTEFVCGQNGKLHRKTLVYKQGRTRPSSWWDDRKNNNSASPVHIFSCIGWGYNNITKVPLLGMCCCRKLIHNRRVLWHRAEFLLRNDGMEQDAGNGFPK